MQSIRKAVFLAAIAVALLVTSGRAAELPPRGVVQSFYDALLGVMKEGPALGFKGRYARLAPAIEQAFNLPLMSRLSIGPQWQGFSPEQQQALAKAFADYTISTYANRFDEFSGEKFEVLPEANPAAGGVLVQSRLIKSDGEPVTLNYLVRQNDGRWQIVDIFLSGTVSELATRRAEFTSVLRRDGAEGLLQLLARRIGELKS